MKVSVAVTSYNGSEYIQELLYSVFNQKRPADEVIIADDCSSDNTVSLVEKFICDRSLEKSWSIYQNEKNCGFVENFFGCMDRTNGDIIFLCDQDDIWLSNKIEIMTDIFEKNSKVEVLLCKENRIDKNGDFIQEAKRETGELSEIKFEREIRECLGAGHLLAVRRELLKEYAEGIRKAGLTFDVPFALVAAARGALYQIDFRLVNRRIHSGNTSGKNQNEYSVLKDKIRYIEGRRCRLKYLQYILDAMSGDLPVNSVKELEKAVVLLNNSIWGLEKKKAAPLLRELISLNRFINKKIAVANLYMCYK